MVRARAKRTTKFDHMVCNGQDDQNFAKVKKVLISETIRDRTKRLTNLGSHGVIIDKTTTNLNKIVTRLSQWISFTMQILVKLVIYCNKISWLCCKVDCAIHVVN